MTTDLDVKAKAYVYGGLTKDTVDDLQMCALRVRNELKRTSKAIVRIGKELISAQETLREDGRFVAWLDLEFSMSRASAYRFINVAQRFDDVSQIENVPASALYALAAPSTPEQVVDATLAQAKAGESVSTTTVSELKAADEEIRNERPVWDHTAADVVTRAEQRRETQERVSANAAPTTDTAPSPTSPAAQPISRPAPVMQPATEEPAPALKTLDMSALTANRDLAQYIEATVRVQPWEDPSDPERPCIVSVWIEGQSPTMRKTKLGYLGSTLDGLVSELIRANKVETGGHDE